MGGGHNCAFCLVLLWGGIGWNKKTPAIAGIFYLLVSY